MKYVNRFFLGMALIATIGVTSASPPALQPYTFYFDTTVVNLTSNMTLTVTAYTGTGGEPSYSSNIQPAATITNSPTVPNVISVPSTIKNLHVSEIMIQIQGDDLNGCNLVTDGSHMPVIQSQYSTKIFCQLIPNPMAKGSLTPTTPVSLLVWDATTPPSSNVTK